jgi:predicted ATPase
MALSPNNEAETETHFQQALDVARHQQAKSLELRAAMSLSRLWQQQASALRLTICWHPSTAGSPKDLTPSTCKRPRRCSTN